MVVRGNGKLLLSGEYLVLKGAEALAIPTRFGQEISFESNPTDEIEWSSFETSTCFLESTFDLKGNLISGKGSEAEMLSKIFKSILELHGGEKLPALKLRSVIDFNRNWGLGSSSSLIYCLSQIADVDPFELLKMTFGGSGYDIACAQENEAILYQVRDGKAQWMRKAFNPSFSDKLHFVYLNKKMNSREALKKFKQVEQKVTNEDIRCISEISNQLADSQSVEEFSSLIESHELLLSNLMEIPTVKSDLFSDYKGAIKSLGAWGGDFVLAIGDADEMEYFRRKGFNTILSFDEIALTKKTK